MGGAIGGEQAPASASGIPKAEKEQGVWLGKSEGEFVMGSRKVRVWVGLCRGGGAGWEQPDLFPAPGGNEQDSMPVLRGSPSRKFKLLLLPQSRFSVHELF